MPSRIIYPTERDTVELRQLVPADAEAYFEAVDASRDHLSQYGDQTAVKYPDLASVVESIEKPHVESKLRMGIWDQETFVGSINLKPIADKAELGYWLDERYVGRGYASIAVRALVARAPRYIDVFAAIRSENEASKNVIKRAGFKLGGTTDSSEYYFYQHPDNPGQQEPVLYAQTIEQDTEHSVARIGLRGLNAAIINHTSDTTYEVEFGMGHMNIGGVNHSLQEGVTVTVPAGTPYQDEGHLVMRATSYPPFEPLAVEHLDQDLL